MCYKNGDQDFWSPEPHHQAFTSWRDWYNPNTRDMLPFVFLTGKHLLASHFPDDIRHPVIPIGSLLQGLLYKRCRHRRRRRPGRRGRDRLSRAFASDPGGANRSILIAEEMLL
jgi:hypothetical protein